jgi:hypothetical protein
MKLKHARTISIIAIPMLAIGCSQTIERVGGGQAELSQERWTTLFNGRDLTGWEAEGGASWTVENGMLIGTQGEANAPGDLFTTDSYSDFLLLITYRVEWPANTGIWFRYQNARKAYQADILEYASPVAYSGTLYCPGKLFLTINSDKSLVDQDGWNTMKVNARGDHLRIWLNDHLVGDVHDQSTDSGRIGFQVHAGEQFGPMKIVVRDIRVKLPD